MWKIVYQMHAIGSGPPLILLTSVDGFLQILDCLFIKPSIAKGAPPFIVIPPSAAEISLYNPISDAITSIVLFLFNA